MGRTASTSRFALGSPQGVVLGDLRSRDWADELDNWITCGMMIHMTVDTETCRKKAEKIMEAVM